jgi:uncharacterized protein (TIGR03435 family)
MVVEAVFWFYPLVWWIRARLVGERERACDEAVLQSGSDAEVYAEGILNVCKFCVESPLVCVSGISGSDLKKRIARIMTECLTDELSLGRKLLLIAVGIATAAGPVVFGLMSTSHVLAQLLQPTNAPLPSFEVASIKPSHPDSNGVQLGFQFPRSFKTLNATAKELIEFAYNVQTDDQLSAAPNWISSAKYDIDAKIEDSEVEHLQKLPSDQMKNQIQFLLQSLLADRFKLKVSYTTKQLPVYALVIAKGGPKLKSPADRAGSRTGPEERGQFSGMNASTDMLVNALSRQAEIGRTVIDETGLKGKYDWTLKWTPDVSTPMSKENDDGSHGSANSAPPDSTGPSLFTAIQEQLGLKLKAKKGPVEVLVIDHVEKPSQN